MAHNTVLNLGAGGDTAATYDLATPGAYPSATGKVALSVPCVSPTSATNPVPVTSVNPMPVSSGGGAATPVAAGTTTAAAVVKASAGRLARVIVIATGTAAVSLYDNASAASGTVLLTIPASTATGTIYDVQMPAANGITVGQVNNSPALLVGYF